MNEQNKLIYPLNGIEMNLLNPDADLITYDKLNNMDNENDLFKKSNKVIILYLLKSKNNGHWVCAFRRNGWVYFWDSYGYSPDYEVDNLTPEERAEYNEKRGRLHYVLRNSNTIYNDKRLQTKGTKTCGCFASHRLNHSEYDNKTYRKIFFNGKYPDVVVADYCLNKLKKII